MWHQAKTTHIHKRLHLEELKLIEWHLRKSQANHCWSWHTYENSKLDIEANQYGVR